MSDPSRETLSHELVKTGLRWRPVRLTRSCKRGQNLSPWKTRWCKWWRWSHGPRCNERSLRRVPGPAALGQLNSCGWHSESIREAHLFPSTLCVPFLPSNVYFALTSICPSAPVEPGASAYLRLQGSGWSCLGTEAVATTRDRQWSKCVQELWAPMDLAPRAGSTPICGTVDK